MKVIEPKIFLPLEELSASKLTQLERYGRTCYKSESITIDGSEKFIRMIMNSGHESVIEHEKATVLIVTDRGVTHELVRHRIGSYSQESTRYCNYSKDTHGGEVAFIRPFFYQRQEDYCAWENACNLCEQTYFKLIKDGKPQEARSILPNSLKTEIVVTFNFREWRHFFKLRCSASAHPQMRQVAIPLLLAFMEKLPSLFEDILYDKSFDPVHYAEVIYTDRLFNPIIY